MAHDYAELYEASMAEYELALNEERIALQRAEVGGDFSERLRATQSMASLRSAQKEYHNMAVEHAATLRPPANASRYGLSEDQKIIAHGISGSDPKLSDDERERIYAENRHKLQRLKATGEYDDSQGKVFK